MLNHFGYAAVLVLATVAVHAACTVWIMGRIRSVGFEDRVAQSHVTRGTALYLTVLLMSVAAVLESGMWAGVYVWVGALPTFEEALYFSLVTFTTLGYGDITLHDDWRLLAGFQAANGIIIFGWTTALFINVAQRVFAERAGD